MKTSNVNYMKYLPVFLLIGGAVFISLIGFIIFNLRSKAPETDKKEEAVKELPSEERPYISLTPNAAGNELKLVVAGIPAGVSVVEYELIYDTAAGVTQGVPGSVDVDGKATLERKLTLGTCSSGVCRYDKGVRDIKISLKLRDSKNKLIAKSDTIGVNLFSGAQKLEDVTDKFSLNLDKKTKDYFVVMGTYGAPSKIPGTLVAGPYGVFTSGNIKQSGLATLPGGIIQEFVAGSWETLSNGKTKTLGTFISTQ